MKNLLLLFLVFLGTSCLAQTFPLSDFTEVPIPKEESAELYRLNNFDKDFLVAIKNGLLTITLRNYKRGDNARESEIPQGKLIAVNAGEWGGGLYYKPTDTTQKEIFINGKKGPTQHDPFSMGLLVKEDNPINQKIKGAFLIKNGNETNIFKFQDSLYMLEEGFSGVRIYGHEPLGSTTIYNINVDGNKFTGSRVVTFNDEPMAMAVYGDTIMVATSEKFYLVTKWKAKPVFEKMFWYMLYPTSIAVVDKNTVYVGINGGYVKLDLSKHTTTFYEYNNLQKK